MLSSQGQRLRRELNSHKTRLKPRAPLRGATAWRIKAPALGFAAEAPRHHWQMNQSVEPPLPKHLCFGKRLCSGGMHFSPSRFVHKTSAASRYKYLFTGSMSARTEHTRLQAVRISLGSVESRVASSLAALPPNPSLSTDPLRQASLPVQRLGLCCAARASRPASAVGVSSNVRQHEYNPCSPTPVAGVAAQARAP